MTKVTAKTNSHDDEHDEKCDDDKTRRVTTTRMRSMKTTKMKTTGTKMTMQTTITFCPADNSSTLQSTS